jgi:hypothetical protein
MYGNTFKPYGELFAENQAVTTTVAPCNLIDLTNYPRLDASQGATGVRVVANQEVTIIATGSLRVLVRRGPNKDTSPPGIEGDAIYVNNTGAPVVFKPGETICTYILTNVMGLKMPYILPQIHGGGTVTGTVDVFPVYLSKPRRG